MKTQKRYICGCHPKANDDNCLNLKGHRLFESDFPLRTTKHTPTSWKVVKHQDYWQVVQKIGFFESEIAMCLRKENADLIVRAVNSHEALMKTLEAVSAFIMNPTDANKILLSVAGATAIKAIAQTERKV